MNSKINDFSAINNIRTLRAIANKVPFEELEQMLSKLTMVVEEKRKEIEKIEAEKAERAEKLETLIKKASDDGIDTQELIEALASQQQSTKKSVRKPRPPKYEYVRDGVKHFWTGQGRTPKEIQIALDNGQSMEDFEIK